VTALVIAVVASQVVALAFLIPVVGRRRVSA
jgi:hypothetical protein